MRALRAYAQDRSSQLINGQRARLHQHRSSLHARMSGRHAASTSCMSCARRSAGCFATCSTLRADRPRAATTSASSPMLRPAAHGPRQRSRSCAPLWRSGSRRVADEPAARIGATSRRRAMSRDARRVARRRRARPRRQGRRLCAARRVGARAIRVYTPHGGSLHYRLELAGRLVSISRSERLLMRRTDLFLFESAYGRDVFDGQDRQAARACARRAQRRRRRRNSSRSRRMPDATDLVFVGELRMLKGVDVLIEAIAILAQRGRQASLQPSSATAPTAAAFEAHGASAGLRPDRAASSGAMPARDAFALGRCWSFLRARNRCPISCSKRAAAGVPHDCDPRRRDSGNLRSRCRRLSVPPAIRRRLPSAIEHALSRPARPPMRAQRLAGAGAGRVLSAMR